MIVKALSLDLDKACKAESCSAADNVKENSTTSKVFRTALERLR